MRSPELEQQWLKKHWDQGHKMGAIMATFADATVIQTGTANPVVIPDTNDLEWELDSYHCECGEGYGVEMKEVYPADE